jgi:hypothetical protein
MLSQENLERIEKILKNPVNAAMIHHAKPYKLSPEALSGNLKAGDRLMVPSGLVRHQERHGVRGPHPSGDKLKPGPIEYEFEHVHTGYWSRITTVTLLLPIEFRGMTPVWMFAISGQCTRSGDAEYDKALMEKVDQHIHKAHKKLFQLRRDGNNQMFFRAPEFHDGHLEYKSHWQGDFTNFSGSEKVTLEYTSIVWQADFFGRIIDPIS